MSTKLTLAGTSKVITLNAMSQATTTINTKYYVIECGEDCDGMSATNYNLQSYNTLEEADAVAEEKAEWSDGLRYVVMCESEAREEGYLQNS